MRKLVFIFIISISVSGSCFGTTTNDISVALNQITQILNSLSLSQVTSDDILDLHYTLIGLYDFLSTAPSDVHDVFSDDIDSILLLISSIDVSLSSLLSQFDGYESYWMYNEYFLDFLSQNETNFNQLLSDLSEFCAVLLEDVNYGVLYLEDIATFLSQLNSKVNNIQSTIQSIKNYCSIYQSQLNNVLQNLATLQSAVTHVASYGVKASDLRSGISSIIEAINNLHVGVVVDVSALDLTIDFTDFWRDNLFPAFDTIHDQFRALLGSLTIVRQYLFQYLEFFGYWNTYFAEIRLNIKVLKELFSDTLVGGGWYDDIQSNQVRHYAYADIYTNFMVRFYWTNVNHNAFVHDILNSNYLAQIRLDPDEYTKKDTNLVVSVGNCITNIFVEYENDIDKTEQDLKTELERFYSKLETDMNEIESQYSTFLRGVKIDLGQFNSVFDFSYKLPFHDDELSFYIDFASSDYQELRTMSRNLSTYAYYLTSGLIILLDLRRLIFGALTLEVQKDVKGLKQ